MSIDTLFLLKKTVSAQILPPTSHILVTGDAPFGGRPKADAMTKTLTRDFHAKNNWIDDQSKDAAENTAYTAAILKQ